MRRLLLSCCALALGLLGLVGSGAFAQVAPDTYVYMTFGDIDTLDPAQAYDTASGQIIENVYETLYGYQGESVTEYEPLLATSYEVSDDNLTYTYTLREGVTFHNGNPFSCEDVEYTVERALVTNPADSAIWFIADSLLGVEANANAALGEDASAEQYAEYFANIDSSVECVDDMTVQFTLDHVDPAFFVKMLFYGMGIIDKEWSIEQGTWPGTEATWRDYIGLDLREGPLHSNMNGTGAYQLVEWQPGTQTILESYEDYWGGAPEIKNVVVQIVDDESARILAMQQGDADRITVDRAALTQLEGAEGVVIMDAAENPELDWSSTTVNTVFMNQEITAENNPYIGSGQLDGNGIPPDFFSDINVRRCFNYAFDANAYIEEILLGQGSQITMALPPSYLGYDPTIPTYELNLEAAEEACRAAYDGQLWETGFEMTIAYNTGNQPRQAVSQILKSNLEFLNPNFTVNVQGIAWPDFLSALDQGLLPAYVSGWAPDYADPDNYIHTFYACEGYYADQIGFCDEQIDEWDAEARTSTDEQRREELYSMIGQRAHELAPLVLLPQGVPFMVVSDELEGVYLNPMYSGEFLWKDISKTAGGEGG